MSVTSFLIVCSAIYMTTTAAPLVQNQAVPQDSAQNRQNRWGIGFGIGFNLGNKGLGFGWGTGSDGGGGGGGPWGGAGSGGSDGRFAPSVKIPPGNQWSANNQGTAKGSGQQPLTDQKEST